MHSEVGIPLADKESFRLREYGGGALLFLGIYNLGFQQTCFKGLMPIKIDASSHMNEDGVDIVTSVVIKYPDNKMAVSTATGLHRTSFQGQYCDRFSGICDN